MRGFLMPDPIPKHYPNQKQKPTTKTVNRTRRAQTRAARATRRSELRDTVMARSKGRCEWSGCLDAAEHMAHIAGIGLGGDPKGIRDELANVAGLCLLHHDLLDGRRLMRLHEIENLLREVVELRPHFDPFNSST